MLAVNCSTVRQNIKDYFDKVSETDDILIVTRKEEKNVVILSLDKYNKLVEAAKKSGYIP